MKNRIFLLMSFLFLSVSLFCVDTQAMYTYRTYYSKFDENGKLLSFVVLDNRFSIKDARLDCENKVAKGDESKRKWVSFYDLRLYGDSKNILEKCEVKN